jgi:hypothetical protein
VEVVGVGGAEAGDGLAGLGPGCGEFGVGVDDAADLGEFAIEQQVGVEIAGGVEVPSTMAVERVRTRSAAVRVVGNAAGLDGDKRSGAVDSGSVDAAGVAEGVDGEAAAGDLLVGVEDLFAKSG